MALFDTNTGLGSLFQGMNIFGAKQPEYLGGLLDQTQQDKLKNQALLSGILGAGATYLSQPKNQNIGLPAILGKSYLGGMQQSQGTYDAATKNLLERLNIEKTARGIELQGMTELDKLYAARDKIATTNPNDPKLKTYDAAIQKQTQFAPPMQVLNYPQPISAINKETGETELVQFPNKPGEAPRPTGYKPPPTQEQLKQQEKITKAQSVLPLLNSAQTLIEGATGSAVGAGYDVLAAGFGKSTAGARNIAELKAIETQLILNMPRLEGPQSDRDAQLYREAAGKIGDPTVPKETKQAALKQIQEIYGRNSGVQMKPAGSNAGTGGWSIVK
jgi:hypothetical protein